MHNRPVITTDSFYGAARIRGSRQTPYSVCSHTPDRTDPVGIWLVKYRSLSVEHQAEILHRFSVCSVATAYILLGLQFGWRLSDVSKAMNHQHKQITSWTRSRILKGLLVMFQSHRRYKHKNVHSWYIQFFVLNKLFNHFSTFQSLFNHTNACSRTPCLKWLWWFITAIPIAI